MNKIKGLARTGYKKLRAAKREDIARVVASWCFLIIGGLFIWKSMALMREIELEPGENVILLLGFGAAMIYLSLQIAKRNDDIEDDDAD